MKKTRFIPSLVMSAAIGIAMGAAAPAQAGFEWTAPVQPAPAPQARPAPQQERAVAAPAAPVVSSPISPFPQETPRMPAKSDGVQQNLVINPYPNQPQSATSAPSSLTDAILMESGTLSPVPSRAMDLQKIQVARSAAMAPVVKEPSYETVQGFGRDIPLAIAMSQIIPADHTYSFSPSVNPGASVSWQGGQPWDQVLNNMLQSQGLSAQIDGRKVMVREGGAPIMAAAPTPAPVMDAGDDMMVNPVIEPMINKPVPVKVAEPKSSYKMSSSAMVSRASDLYDLESTDAQPRPRMPARISRLGTSAPETEVMAEELVMKPEAMSGNAVFEEGLNKGMEPVPMGEPVDLSLPEDMEPAPAEAQPMQMTPRPIMPEPVVSQALPAADRPAALKMAAMPSRGYDLERQKTWRAVRGDSLRTVLTDWADVAGVDITWNSQYDYPLDASVRTQGTFEQAVQDILTGLKDARPRPIGRLHPNLPDGPPALIIETQQIIE